MTTILDTKLIDLMPESYRDIPDIQYICGALQPQIDEIVAAINKILFRRLDGLDDLTLDYLLQQCGISNSVEMLFLTDRQSKINFIQNYIELKRYKGTKKGIKYVLELLDIDATIVEWFENGGEPYTFDIDIEYPEDMTIERIKFLTSLVDTYKNTRSHYSIDADKEINDNLKIAQLAVFADEITISSKDLRTKSRFNLANLSTFADEITLAMKGT